MDREWRDLDPMNLPSDILVERAWEVEEITPDGEPICTMPAATAMKYVAITAEGRKKYNPFRIRRPKGYEEKEIRDWNRERIDAIVEKMSESGAMWGMETSDILAENAAFAFILAWQYLADSGILPEKGSTK